MLSVSVLPVRAESIVVGVEVATYKDPCCSAEGEEFTDLQSGLGVVVHVVYMDGFVA